ncbi:MAG TPA: mechanosensitive ion channel domain-containing protein [Candidatus Saccharimonadia bacterium]
MNLIDLSSPFTDHILDGINHLVPRLPGVLFDLLLGIIVIRVMVRLSKLVMKWVRVPAGLRGVINSIFESFLWVLLTINVLSELGYSGIIYFFSGSIAAIGIAMAAGGSTLVSDIVAGIFLARDIDFNVGDEVIVGETPTQGIIERMDARRIRLRDQDGILHVIPNSVVERKEWVLIKRRAEISALARAAKVAKKLGAAAREKNVRST